MAGAMSRLFARASVRPTDDSQDFERASGGARASATPSFRATSDEWKRKAWKSAGERVMQSRRETKGAPTSIADVVRRAKVESSVQAARRLLQAARDKTKKAVAAKGSRNVVFNSGYVYFLVLESSWLFTVALSLSAYVMSILFCWAISAPLGGLRDTAEELGVDVSDESPALLSLRFAASHVITGGPGSVVPTDDSGHFVSHLSMLVGVVVNVFVFAAVVAKFQSPQKDLVWSTRAVMSRRDGTPTLMLRVGNLRCHTLYNPVIRCTLLSRHVTSEGEGYMKKEAVQVMQPATVSGVHTVACAVSPDSPLFPILKTPKFAHCAENPATKGTSPGGGETGRKGGGDGYESSSSSGSNDAFRWLLHVTFTATDPIYNAELCSHTTYDENSLEGPARFVDVIGFDAGGRPMIDWHKFDEHVEGCEHCDDEEEEEEEEDGFFGASVRGDKLDAEISARVDALRAAQTNAAAREEYVEAKRWKDEISRVESTRSAIVEAERRKRDAVRAERYDLADAIKKETNALRASVGLAVAGIKPSETRPREIKPSGDENPAAPENAARPRRRRVSSSAADDTAEERPSASSSSAEETPPKDASPPPRRVDDPAPRRDDPPRLALRASRASYGDESRDGAAPLGPLAPVDPECQRVALLFAEAGVPFETRLVDASDPPAWFPSGTSTPAAFGSPGGEDDGRWLAGADEIVARARTRSAAFAAVANDDGRASLDVVQKLTRRLLDDGNGGGNGAAEGSACSVSSFADALAETEALVASLGGGFVGGDAPNPADASLAATLHWTRSALESGLSPHPRAPCSLEEAGAPSIASYLDRWRARPSWVACYGTTCAVSAAAVRDAVDASGLSAAARYVVAQRARNLDDAYRRVARWDAPTFLSVVCGDSERSVAGPSGPPRPGCPRVAALSARGSRGVGDDIDGDAPQGPIVPYCTYCVRFCLALAEARVPFELVMIDRNCKQSWFHDAFPAFITPAMQGSPGGNPRDPNEWVGDSRALLVAAAEQEAKVRELVDKPSVVTLDQAEKLGETLKAALVGGRAIGSSRSAGAAFALECLAKCGVDAEAADPMSADDRRAALLRVGTETTAEIEATLRSARGPFLAGDAPGAADCSLAATLWVAHNLLASGTALCYAKAHARGSAACSFAQIGGPSVERYLAAWARRPSWRAALRTNAVNSAAAIRPIVDSLVDAAGDVCSGETMLECMTRVRAADDYYNAAVRAERHNLPAVPPPELRPRRVRVGVDAQEPTPVQAPRPEVREVPEPRREIIEPKREVPAPPIDVSPPPIDVPAPAPAVEGSASRAGPAAGDSQKRVKKSKSRKSRTNATICI